MSLYSFKFWHETYSRVWIFWGWECIIFDKRNLFLFHFYHFGACGNRISIRFWFAFIPSHHPLSPVIELGIQPPRKKERKKEGFLKVFLRKKKGK